MELDVEQHREEKNKFQNKMENVLQENDRLLTQALSVEIMNVVVHDNVKFACLNVDVCAHCVTIESELKNDFLKKECYETLLQKYHTLEKHCKAILTKAVSLNPTDPELLKVNVAPLVPKLHKNRTAHTDYIRHTQEEAATLREIVKRVILVSSASGSMSQDNTKKNRIRRTQRKAKKNKIEEHIRTVKSSLNKKSVVDSKATSSVINSVSNVNSDLKCASCNGCLFSNNHDACVVAYIKSVNASRRTFTLVGNVCPLIRIATPTIVPPREPIPIVNSTDKPMVTLVYTRKPKAANKKVPNKLEPNNSWDPQVPMFLLHFLHVGCPNHPRVLGLRNDHVAKILGYGDYQIGNVTISQVRLNVPVRRIRTDNVTEFVNQTLCDYCEEVGISHETSVARSPKQNRVVERRNHTFIEAARTIKLLDLSFFHVFGALCYPANDIENLAMASEQRSSGAALIDMTPGTISSGLGRTSSPSTSYVPPSRNDWDLLFQQMFDELLNPPPSVVSQAPEVIAPITEVIPLVHTDLTGSPSSTTVDQDAPSQSKTHTTTETQSLVIP
nr:hypothetical protein [Tanacetum cinerariifolium]